MNKYIYILTQIAKTLWTDLVFGVFQIEHEGPILVLVLAVSVKAQVEHLLFNGNSQFPHLALRHIQIITVTHPEREQQLTIKSWQSSFLVEVTGIIISISTLFPSPSSSSSSAHLLKRMSVSERRMFCLIWLLGGGREGMEGRVGAEAAGWGGLGEDDWV